MATLELALILMATVLLSAILDQLIPRLSLPLIQIALGVIVGLISTDRITITLNPEIFLVLFIAPLLFHEAREANNLSLWRNRRMMLSYAIGLVIAIVLIVGFTVNLIAPSIPLACAFALGAALGPTDRIAVASISERAKIPERLKITLQGESLLNDASGIVSFQFAVAAVVTGTFSLASALKTFAIEFFGDFPEEGDSFVFDRYTITVSEMDERRVTALLVSKNKEPEEGGETEEDAAGETADKEKAGIREKDGTKETED